MVIPKVTETSTNNAICQFKRCLFRLEVLDSYSNIIALRENLQELENLQK